MQPLITKTTRDGKQLVITQHGGDFVATLDGAQILQVATPGMWVAAKQLHILGGKIGLSRQEGEMLIAARRAWADGIVVEPTRADLIATYQGLLDEQAAVYERAHDRQDARAMQIRMSYDAKIEAAAQAIRDYDAAHPEEAAAREAARAESLERNRWM